MAVAVVIFASIGAWNSGLTSRRSYYDNLTGMLTILYSDRDYLNVSAEKVGELTS
ncbi:MAG: hypothetical protein ACRD47_02545 [Nitrososphaeraceae archaeon]|jgi:hypothetical protein